MGRLRLVEHRRRVQRRAPRAGEELGRAKEDGGALVPRHPRPVVVAAFAARSPARHARAALADVGEDVALRCGSTASNVSSVWTSFPPMIIGMGIRSLSICAEPGLELGALGRAGRIGHDRLVDRQGRREESGCAHGGDSRVDRGDVVETRYSCPAGASARSGGAARRARARLPDLDSGGTGGGESRSRPPWGASPPTAR